MTVTAKSCRSCGACCVATDGDETYPMLMDGDYERLGEKFVRLHVLYGSVTTKQVRVRRGPLAGTRLTCCTALRGVIGLAVVCGVYEARPEICRTALQPGDDVCLAIRREQGLDR